MSRISHLRTTDELSLWHVRGAVGFLGSLMLISVAVAITDQVTGQVVVAVLSAGVTAAVAATIMRFSGVLGRRWSLMLWPAALMVSMACVQLHADQVPGLISGLMVVCFLFVGVTQSPGHFGWLLVPASLVFCQVQNHSPVMTAVRLGVAVGIWILCSELPARLIKELQETQAELRRLATSDSLTGVLNRSMLESSVQRVGNQGAVAMIDLDDFKKYNDQYGHLVGDGLLIDFAATLRDGVRPQDRVIRYGGEEFLLVLDGVTLDDAVAVVQRLRERWATHPSGLTFSAGVARCGSNVIASADALLYKAKSAGRDRVVTGSLMP